MLNERFSRAVRDDEGLRTSFNILTRKIFGFDFVDWYEAGHWGDLYVPHVILDGDRVVSNVSVNWIRYDMGGRCKTYIQLGTIMTDPEYRGLGLNRRLIEWVLSEYKNQADGIYLFANDSVISYYPKFGFRMAKEYEYYMPICLKEDVTPYSIRKVDMSQKTERWQLYHVIQSYASDDKSVNQNDGLYMCENLSLYQFWMAADFGESIYYLPENRQYVAADVEGSTLRIHQIFGKEKVDVERLGKSFGAEIKEIVLGYMPAQREKLLVREHKEEDTTLFILGKDLDCIERKQMIFPILSHA